MSGDDADCSFLVADGRDWIGADGSEVDRAVPFFVDLANEDASAYSKRRAEGDTWRERRNAHHITLDKVEAKRYLLDALVDAVHALFRIRQDDVGFLVVTREHALGKLE